MTEETGDSLRIEYYNRQYNYNKFNGRGQPYNYYKLSNLRIIQKKLVYIIGLSTEIATKESELKEFEYFGQYGKISKLIVNKNKTYNTNGPNGPSFSAYITYSSCDESSLAILSLDNTIVDNHLLRASYGTTKYCSNFLKGIECMNKECLYLHYLAEASNILEREDMNLNKTIFLSQQIIAMKEADIFNPDVKRKLLDTIVFKTVLPGRYTIYDKEIVKDHGKSILGNIANPSPQIKTFTNEERAALEEFSSKSTAGESCISLTDYQFLSQFNSGNLSKGDLENTRFNYENNYCKYNNYNNTNTTTTNSPTYSYNEISNHNNNQSVDTNKSTLYRPKEKSRFIFANKDSSNSLSNNNINLAIFNSCGSINSFNTTQDTRVEIPCFVNDLIYKKISRFSFFKNFVKNEEDFTYFDKNLIKEYAENNPWAVFIINNIQNKNLLDADLKNLIEKEKLLLIKKFNTA